MGGRGTALGRSKQACSEGERVRHAGRRLRGSGATWGGETVHAQATFSHTQAEHTCTPARAHTHVLTHTHTHTHTHARVHARIQTCARCRSGIDEVALPLLPFMSAYVARLKALHKRHGGALPPGCVMHVRAMLGGIAMCARYPLHGSANEGGRQGGARGAPSAEAKDEQAEVGGLCVPCRVFAVLHPSSRQQRWTGGGGLVVAWGAAPVLG